MWNSSWSIIYNSIHFTVGYSGCFFTSSTLLSGKGFSMRGFLWRTPGGPNLTSPPPVICLAIKRWYFSIGSSIIFSILPDRRYRGRQTGRLMLGVMLSISVVWWISFFPVQSIFSCILSVWICPVMLAVRLLLWDYGRFHKRLSVEVWWWTVVVLYVEW